MTTPRVHSPSPFQSSTSYTISSDGDWLVIDPKGVIGAPIHEMWALVMDIKKDIPFIANFFGFTRQSMYGWYFVHLVKAICWNLEDNLESKLFLELAEKVYPLI